MALLGKTRRAIRVMRGGKFKGKGTYGCAFNPPLKCRGESTRRNSRHLSKLLFKDAANAEYKESIPFRKIDPEKRFFIWSDAECLLNQRNIRITNEIEKCPKSVVNYRNPSASLLFYEMGGSDLSKIELEAADYSPFLISIGNLIKGLSILHANGICHCDIKPDNMVTKSIGDTVFSSRYIDFGLASDTTRITSSSPKIELLSKHPYIYYPFNIKYLWSGRQKGTSAEEIQRWYNEIGSTRFSFPQSTYWNRDWTPKYSASDFEALRTQNNFIKDTRKGLEGVDVFALGVSLIEVYSRLMGHYMRGAEDMPYIVVLVGRDEVPVEQLTVADFNGNEELLNWHIAVAKFLSKPFYTLMGGMISINPRNRISAEAAANIYQTRIIPRITGVLNDPTIIEKGLKALGIRVLPSTRPGALEILDSLRGTLPLPPPIERSKASAVVSALRGPMPPPPTSEEPTNQMLMRIAKKYRNNAASLANNDPKKLQLISAADKTTRTALELIRSQLEARLSMMSDPATLSQIQNTIKEINIKLSR